MPLENAANWALLVFMAAVTCVVLALAFAEMAKGIAHAPATFVYALTAAFGLEYMISAFERATRRRV